MKPVQELFPHTIVMDDGDTGGRRVIDGEWVGEAVKLALGDFLKSPRALYTNTK